MKVYQYDKNKIFDKEIILDDSDKSPSGTYNIPANATAVVPPTEQDGYARVWNGEVWEQVVDNRGKEYWLDTDEYDTPAHKMEELGEFPENAVFTAPEKPLELAKADKVAELKAQRDRLEVEPVEYNGNTFDFDDKARERINNAITALSLNEGATLEWTLADNTSATVTATDLKNVIGVAVMRSNSLHIAYREAKVKVEEANTKEEVEAVVLEV